MINEVTVNYPVTEHAVRNLLVSALEGGSNYWMRIFGYDLPIDATLEDFISGSASLKDDFCSDNWHPAYVVPFHPLGGLILQDKEEPVTYTLTLEKINNGLRLMAQNQTKHFLDFINENDDATTADVFLQMALFGELVYG